MTHPERDPDLLLLAHGELPPLAALRTRRHLSRCPDCRRRLAEWEAVSRRLAVALRDPGMPPWSPRPVPAFLSGFLPWLLLVTSVALVIALGTLAVRSHAPTAPPPLAAGCRPDLPNDRCR